MRQRGFGSIVWPGGCAPRGEGPAAGAAAPGRSCQITSGAACAAARQPERLPCRRYASGCQAYGVNANNPLPPGAEPRSSDAAPRKYCSAASGATIRAPPAAVRRNARKATTRLLLSPCAGSPREGGLSRAARGVHRPMTYVSPAASHTSRNARAEPPGNTWNSSATVTRKMSPGTAQLMWRSTATAVLRENCHLLLRGRPSLRGLALLPATPAAGAARRPLG